MINNKEYVSYLESLQFIEKNDCAYVFCGKSIRLNLRRYVRFNVVVDDDCRILTFYQNSILKDEYLTNYIFRAILKSHLLKSLEK